MRRIKAEPGDLALLSPKEQAIARFVVQGLPTKQIAYKTRLSSHTVRNYLAGIMSGLGVDGRQDVANWVLCYPAVLAGFAVPVAPHPPGCRCHSPYCIAMRNTPEAA